MFKYYLILLYCKIKSADNKTFIKKASGEGFKVIE